MADGDNEKLSHRANLQSWIDKWEADANPDWKMKDVNPYIEKYKDDLTKGLECAKIFFPLCGDVADMRWLADMGHVVVGVEISPVAIEQFFKNNKIEYTITTVVSMAGTVYTSKNGSIRIYCGDFFLFDPSIEKDFDGTWDGGSFTTIDDPEMKKKYIEILKSVMKPGGNIILEFVLQGNDVDVDEIEGLFGKNCKIVDLGIVEPENYAPEYVELNIKFHLFRIGMNT